MLIYPNWKVPSRIKSFTTTNRFMTQAGHSVGNYASFNLANHVGDDPQAVLLNRQLLTQALLPQEPCWLNQCHSNKILELPLTETSDLNVDASYSTQANQVCAILTADCMPILITNTQGSLVAAIHAGWQGLLNGVIENSLAALKQDPQQLICWVGPAIGAQDSFVVQQNHLEKFLAFDPMIANFTKVSNWGFSYTINLPQVAAHRLTSAGVLTENVYLSNRDTYQEDIFYSYRRNRITGRIATCIWIDDSNYKN